MKDNKTLVYIILQDMMLSPHYLIKENKIIFLVTTMECRGSKGFGIKPN